jgi:general secretion pathway protein A
MYERFYNFRERPFSLTPDPDYLYPSRVHAEALTYLRYAFEGRASFVVITGEIGSGKTTLLQTVLRDLDDRVLVARLMNTQLDARELLEALMLDFGLDVPAQSSKPQMIRDFARFLVEAKASGRNCLLVVDEAQNLSTTALEEMRMLSNLETDKTKLLQLMLVGQPSLRERLSRPELEQLRQRVSVSHHLTALDREDTAAYIRHRLHRAAIAAPVEFPPGVSDLVHQRSGGLPRAINVIADAILLYGYGEERRSIDLALARKALADLAESGVLGLDPDEEIIMPAPGPFTASPPLTPVPVTTPPAQRQQRIVMNQPQRRPRPAPDAPGLWARARRALSQSVGLKTRPSTSYKD